MVAHREPVAVIVLCICSYVRQRERLQNKLLRGMEAVSSTSAWFAWLTHLQWEEWKVAC